MIKLLLFLIIGVVIYHTFIKDKIESAKQEMDSVSEPLDESSLIKSQQEEIEKFHKELNKKAIGYQKQPEIEFENKIIEEREKISAQESKENAKKIMEEMQTKATERTLNR